MPEDRDPSLYVQVGEQKCVFKYGERNDPGPRLIESVISYIKDEDDKGQRTLFTQTLRRNRSASEEAFFSKQNRKLSIEKGSGAYGLTGASNLESSEIQEKQPQRRKRGARGQIKKNETGSFAVETTETVLQQKQ